MADKPVTLAAIAGAHGITGEVRLKLFGEGVESLKRFRAFNDSALTLEKLRSDNKGGAIARFAEVKDRNAAEALKGTELFVPRERLPAPEEDEVYVHDLIGLPVHLADGSLLGEIVGVADYGAGDLIDVKVEGRKDTVLIPFASQYVLEADGNKVVVDLPEGYLEVEEQT